MRAHTTRWRTQGNNTFNSGDKGEAGIGEHFINACASLKQTDLPKAKVRRNVGGSVHDRHRKQKIRDLPAQQWRQRVLLLVDRRRGRARQTVEKA